MGNEPRPLSNTSMPYLCWCKSPDLADCVGATLAQETSHAARQQVDQSISSQIYRANFLATSNRKDDQEKAKPLLLEIISAEPSHLEAWSMLGELLFKTGFISAACTAYTAALNYHPNVAALHVNLGYVLLHIDDLDGARAHFKVALGLATNCISSAHKGLALAFHRLGDREQSNHHRDLGFRGNSISTLPYRGEGNAVNLLILGSAYEGNIPWHFFVDTAVFQVTIIATEYFDLLNLPPHDLIFNAIGDADLCGHGLRVAGRLLEETQMPVINRPDTVLKTGRFENVQRLAHLLDVILPRIVITSQTDIRSGRAIESINAGGLSFPLLLRATGFHGGKFFVYVESQDALFSAANAMPSEDLLAIELLDYRSEDLLFRKYRVMSIDNVLYPLHMAISNTWKVHYFSSDMEIVAHYRDEEAEFLNNFTDYLGANSMAALERVKQTLGLDYCGIDFAISRFGEILIFEANPTMVINPTDNGTIWDYKRGTIQNAINAAKTMFLKRAQFHRV